MKNRDIRVIRTKWDMVHKSKKQYDRKKKKREDYEIIEENLDYDDEQEWFFDK